ncbi:MAG: DNA replication and repair protein RecF, partial [Bacteroidia bacterium]
EGSESRRKFTDSVISQFNRNYLDDLINYNKALSQRNALLKRFSESRNFEKESLDIWNDQLMGYGKKIFSERKKFVDAFIPTFQKYYELISGGNEKVELEYISQLNRNSFEEILENALQKDRVLQHSTAGIHKDDLQFTMDQFPVKKFGSQGQQKSYLIALKLAQFDFIKKIKGTTPILLLDDIHDRLDDKRVRQLMDLVSSEQFGQVFITDTNALKIEALFNEKKIALKMFRIKNGAIV